MEDNFSSKVYLRIGLLFIFTAFLLIISSGSFSYWNAWIVLGFIFIPLCILCSILIKKNPFFLKQNLDFHRIIKRQDNITFIIVLIIIAGLLVSGLDYRFKLTKNFPLWIYIQAFIIFCLSYLIIYESLKENRFFTRTVFDVGLYGVIRHPTASAAILFFLSIPLILNSFFAFLIYLIIPFLIIKKINKDEMILSEEIYGYEEYKKRVKYKIIPLIY